MPQPELWVKDVPVYVMPETQQHQRVHFQIRMLLHRLALQVRRVNGGHCNRQANALLSCLHRHQQKGREK